MNWDDLRFVLALAKAGSLAGAARELKVDHTTVGRRVEALEGDLGVRLFTRTPSGYVLTAEADSLLPHVQKVEAAVLAVDRSAKARDECLSGAIRLTAAETFGSRYLAARLAPFTRRHPELSVELITGFALMDLGRREADVAVRLFRSKQDHLVVQRAADVGFGLYASGDYLARHPSPKSPEDLGSHAIVTLDLRVAWDSESSWFEGLAAGASIAFRSNNTGAVLEATKSGMGIGVLPHYLGGTEPDLTYLPMPGEPVSGVYLTVHRDMQNNRKVRAMLDYLKEVLRADADLLRGKTR
jgi:DNA-binding transcriptional LysR family regulator